VEPGGTVLRAVCCPYRSRTPKGGEIMEGPPDEKDEKIEPRREGAEEMRESPRPPTEAREHEGLNRFVHVNLTVEDPNATLQEALFRGALSTARCPGSGRRVVETGNFADLREAVSVCAEQGCSLTEGLVRGLHRRLMEGVSEAPGGLLKAWRV
jgi:hypothetical protein